MTNQPSVINNSTGQGIGTLKAISYRAYLQAAKRRTGPVWDFYQLSLRHFWLHHPCAVEYPTHAKSLTLVDPLAHRQGI